MAYNKVTPLSFSDYCDPYFMVVTSSSLSCTGSAEISWNISHISVITSWLSAFYNFLSYL